MCFAAGIEPPRQVFGHGFVYFEGDRMSKTMGNVVEPMDLIQKFNAEAFRYYFLRECPFPGDGNFSWKRFEDLYNADLANNLGNLYSRVVTIITRSYDGRLAAHPGDEPGAIYNDMDIEAVVRQVQGHVEACRYNQALQAIWQHVLDPANRYADRKEPWKAVKTDKEAARQVLLDMVEQLRAAAILLKPFLPRTAETIYRSFNFPQAWESVRYEDAWSQPRQSGELRVTAALEGSKVRPLFPRIV
jgi:methionyl-tRNA synthetase